MNEEEQNLKNILLDMKKEKKKKKKLDIQNQDKNEYIINLKQLYRQLQDKKSKKNTVIPTPIMELVGPKKSVWTNFIDICNILKRNPYHFSQYITSELGSESNMNQNNQLVIKGYFLSKSIENIIRRYISEYVSCSMCRSLDTFMERDKIIRLDFLHCYTCRASRSLNNII